mmetsp:Transcript_39172/g.94115  ORF Transcript_39172/g.94115 Transcript_39172/m.94115 type:complete len:374 (-) Transcript_39172:53-1174(-)
MASSPEPGGRPATPVEGANVEPTENAQTTSVEAPPGSSSSPVRQLAPLISSPRVTVSQRGDDRNPVTSRAFEFPATVEKKRASKSPKEFSFTPKLHSPRAAKPRVLRLDVGPELKRYRCLQLKAIKPSGPLPGTPRQRLVVDRWNQAPAPAGIPVFRRNADAVLKHREFSRVLPSQCFSEKEPIAPRIVPEQTAPVDHGHLSDRLEDASKFYDVLGVPKGAPLSEIQRAFVSACDDAEDEDRKNELIYAYEILTDGQKRRKHNMQALKELAGPGTSRGALFTLWARFKSLSLQSQSCDGRGVSEEAFIGSIGILDDTTTARKVFALKKNRQGYLNWEAFLEAMRDMRLTHKVNVEEMSTSLISALTIDGSSQG